jgi:Tol biopolymer transport system component
MTLAFEPDGRDIVFTVNKSFEGGTRGLFVAEADSNGDLTGVYRALAGFGDGVIAIDVHSSQDADAFVVTTWATGDLDDGTPSDVWFVSADASSMHDLTRGEIDPVDVGWLPDGSAVEVLTADGNLVVVDPDSLQRSIIASGLVGESGGASARCSWAPDAASVAFSVLAHDMVPSIEVVHPISGTREVLAAFAPGSQAVPLFSADGSKVFTFLSYVDAGGEEVLELYEMASVPPTTPLLLADLSPGAGGSADVSWPLAHPGGDHLFYI